MKRLPPYGKELAERLKFRNLPLFAVVCVGMDSWARAKAWNALEPKAMVLPPDAEPHALSWPVRGVPVVVDANVGPSEEQISDLALTLLQAGSLLVICVSESRSHPFRKFQWSQKP